MFGGDWLVRTIGVGLPAALVALTIGGVAAAEPPRRGLLRQPVFRVARQPDEPQPSAEPQPPQAPAQPPQKHPLAPAIDIAKQGLTTIDANIKDYSCTLIKREQIDDKVGEHEYIFMKVRHDPFSVYMYFLGPANIKGRECIYVAGRNEGKMTAHEGGLKGKLIPTVDLDPSGFIAMRGQRYPITEVGVRTLTARLVEVAEADAKFGECDVKFFKGAKVNGRVCTSLQVMHPVPRQNFRFHLAQVFIDDELQIPIRYASYGWPAAQGGQPQLLEEYTYLNMKLNNGFTDADFDRTNKQYNFD